MKTALLFTILAAATTSQALTLTGKTDLTEWNTTQAGEALLKQDAVSAKAEVTFTGDLKLAYKGYAKIEVCDEHGESPNGEPEFAPCIKSHMTFAPKFELSAPATVVTTVEDVQAAQTTTLSTDLTSCIENYDSLIQLQIPTTPPVRATLKASCDLYLASSELKVSGSSAKLANAKVSATGQLLLEGQLKSSRTLTIDYGRVSADTAKEIAEATKTLKSAGGYSQLDVQATVKNRAGKPLDLFNYALRIDLK